MFEKHTVSHSEVESFTRCQNMHRYGYGYRMATLQQSPWSQIGNAFHEFAKIWYDSLRDTQMHFMESKQAVIAHMPKMIEEGKYYAEHIAAAFNMFIRYMDDSSFKEWEPIYTERYLEYQFSDGSVFNGEIDLIARIVKSPNPSHIGKLAIIDHKTCYNFFTGKEVALHAQIPKYMHAVNKLGWFDEPIEIGIINQVRNRQDARPGQFLKRDYIEPIPLRIANIITEHTKVADQIIERRQLPLEQWRSEVTLTAIKDVCKNCDFWELCDFELDGKSFGDPDFDARRLTYFRQRDDSYRLKRNGRP